MDKPNRSHGVTFVALVFLLAVPFWILSPFVDLKGIPLVFAEFSVVAPMTAALILRSRENGGPGAKDLLRRAVDFRRMTGKAWYVPVFLLMPLIVSLIYFVQILLGRPIPAPQASSGTTAIMFAVFFVGAVAEELGWQGYLFERLQPRWNALSRALLLGVIWGLWHLPAYVFLGHTPLSAALWYFGILVELRVVIVWLYNNTGKSVFASSIVHSTYNLGLSVFFPLVSTPHEVNNFDPVIACVLLFLAIIPIVYLWGTQTLTHYRYRTNLTKEHCHGIHRS